MSICNLNNIANKEQELSNYIIKRLDAKLIKEMVNFSQFRLIHKIDAKLIKEMVNFSQFT